MTSPTESTVPGPAAPAPAVPGTIRPRPRALSFLVPAHLVPARPAPVHPAPAHPGGPAGYGPPEVIELFELGEALGYDRGWLRREGGRRDAASVVTLLSAVGQRTRVLGLGAAGLPIHRDSAIELLTLDALVGGRVHAGFRAPARPVPARPVPARSGPARSAPAGSAGEPSTGARSRGARPPGVALAPWTVLIDRLAGGIRPAPNGTPQVPAGRVWCVTDDPSTARWAVGRGLNLLTTALRPKATTGVGDDVPAPPDAGVGRTAITRVLLPTDSAGPTARRTYAARRESLPVGAIAGSSCQILERLALDPAVSAADELVVPLPVGLGVAEHAQILHDVATYVAPELGFGIAGEVGPCGDADGRTPPLDAPRSSVRAA